MALVLSEDGKSFTFKPAEPLTRVSLLANNAFCNNVSEVLVYIESLKWDRNTNRSFFLSNTVSNQFNTSIQEKTEDEPAFSIDAWYTASKEKGDVDWFSELVDEELRVNGGFVQALRNCVELEDKIQNGTSNRMRNFIASGRADKDMDVSACFFDSGVMSESSRSAMFTSL